MVRLVGSSSDKRTASGNTAGEWLVNVADDVVVPMTTLEVIDGVRAERLSDQSLVWRIGMHDWTRIADVPQLRLVAGTRSQPPASARVTQPLAAQAESQRRRNTLPFGFPAMNELASGRQPGASSLPGNGEPLAVYDRPTPSLTFSDAARADWERNVPSAQRLTPVPSMPTPLSQKPQSTIPNSLAPTTAETDGTTTRGPGAWGDLNELLANERRADQRNSRRAVLLAALGSAALAAAFALWLLKWPAPRSSEPPAQAVQASEAPARAPTLEAPAMPIASAETGTAPAVPHPAASKRLAPRGVKRTKSAFPGSASSRAPVEAEAVRGADGKNESAAVPSPSPEPAIPIVTPAPLAPPAPDGQ